MSITEITKGHYFVKMYVELWYLISALRYDTLDLYQVS